MRIRISPLPLAWSATLFLSGAAGAAILPEARSIDWSPGIPGGIPERSTLCSRIESSSFSPDSLVAADSIQAAIDHCPDNQVVKLGPGVYKLNHSLFLNRPVVLRGEGPDQTILKVDPPHKEITAVYLGLRWFKNTQSTPLAKGALRGDSAVELATALPLSAGEIVLLDQTTDTSLVEWGSRSPVGDVSRTWFTRPDRPLGQILEVKSVSGNVVHFRKPLHLAFPLQFSPQISRYAQNEGGEVLPVVKFAGLEDLRVTQSGNGSIALANAAYCWVRNVESDHQFGAAIDIDGSYQCEVRDSYFHSTSMPVPGGGGYGISFSFYSSENLLENNISWNMNKVMVMRASGGGNVIGYNYFEDGVIAYAPEWVEVGANSSHMTCPHFELFEGNQAFNFDGDNTWGNAIYITALRNHFTGKRRNLDTFKLRDESNPRAVGLEEGHRWYSFLGNVLGTKDMDPSPRSGYVYDAPFPENNDLVPMWKLGYNPEDWGAPPDPRVLATTLRHGNFDFFTKIVHWDSTISDHTIPASLYRKTKPAFFGELPWPWVDPLGTNVVQRLPARERFDRMLGLPVGTHGGAPAIQPYQNLWSGRARGSFYSSAPVAWIDLLGHDGSRILTLPVAPNQTSIPLPSGLRPGLHLYRARSTEGILVAQGSVLAL